ncbi:aspartic acid-rich protein-like [Manihot esculenta]|uniref:aspartic acid-rich protein-like n=1 Tax=Manihot esculenta TaxID=3983 RepID=UPI000B5D5E18|nr:aspartic acid-rich protein-like [Manihot esculenta]
MSTKLNRVLRNYDGGHVEPMECVSIFTHTGRPFEHLNHGRMLSNEEIFYSHLQETIPNISDQQVKQMRERKLANWLKKVVEDDEDIEEEEEKEDTEESDDDLKDDGVDSDDDVNLEDDYSK